jgi:TetR/AcrR family transcriptional regulator, transcriptional repressor for nem operon
MRYAPDYKRQARLDILEKVGPAVKAKGYHAVGVDELARAAGVTSGAIYSHFGSKEALMRDVIRSEFVKRTERLDALARTHGDAWLPKFIDHYLSEDHLGATGFGCPLPALAADIERSPEGAKAVYREVVEAFVTRIAGGLVQLPETRRREVAWALTASLVGFTALLRALPEGALRETWREQARAHCLRLTQQAS